MEFTAIEKKFYHLFWTDPTCQQIFLLHKSQLLENEVELILTTQQSYARRLVLTNSLERKIGDLPAERAKNENIEVLHQLQETVKKYFDESMIEKAIKGKIENSLIQIEKALENSPDIMNNLLSYMALGKDELIIIFLKNFDIIPQSINTMEDFLSFVENQFYTFLKKVIYKENLFDLTITIDLISTFYNHKIKTNLIGATKHYTDQIYSAELHKNRIPLFDKLFEIKAISGGLLKSHYECTSCPPGTYSGTLTLNLKPSKLKMKCPACNKELYYIVPYELDSGIFRHIIQDDGILFSAVQYLLMDNKFKFQQNHKNGSDVEIDILVLDSTDNPIEQIELKMFKLSTPEATQLGNIGATIGQIKKATEKIINTTSSFAKLPKSIITNISDSKILDKAKDDFKNDMKNYNIRLYSPDQYYRKIRGTE